MHKSCVIPFNQGNRRAYRKPSLKQVCVSKNGFIFQYSFFLNKNQISKFFISLFNDDAVRKQISKLKIEHTIEETAKNLNIPYRINLKSHRLNY